MAKSNGKRNGKKKKEEEMEENPHHERWIEVRKSMASVILFAAGLVMLLGSLGKAGPAGDAIYNGLGFLFGWGYFLLPAIFFLLSAMLVRSTFSHKTSLPIFFGGSLMLLAGLGLLDKVNPDKAGGLGTVVGSISNLFGDWATPVILAAVGIVGVLLTFNISLIRKPKEVAVDEPILISPPLAPEALLPAAEPEVKADNKVAQEENKNSSESREFKFRKRIAGSTWQYPPLDIFDSDSGKPTSGDIRANANIIKRTLENFGIPVEMSEVNVGPTITQYTLKPAQGVKLAKIVNLHNDLSLALAAHPIRIEAPIPGKSLVGIEVPNHAAALVRLRNLLQDKNFQESHSALSFVLGRDVMGMPTVTDLAKMPHLLIAGATGTGKSIFLHALLSALLFKNAPESLRLILIDPKRVELSLYQGVPHLLSPVITQGKQALSAFRWAVGEMERRYDLLLEENARDINSYNSKFFSAEGGSASGGEKSPSRLLPYIVIVIDELADLMATYGREVEGSIVRLAQMARATGLHLIVSTQRPSVEVITGLIKANITSRVAFQVASQVDSRTILDMSGAEKLLGNGDLLFIAPDSSKPKRIQGPYVTEQEVKRLVSFLEKAGESYIDTSDTADFVPVEEDEGEQGDLEFSDDQLDPLYDQAVQVVTEAKKASASLLQRRLKLGYARAARLLDMMEARGVVGPGDGAKPREVFLNDNDEQ